MAETTIANGNGVPAVLSPDNLQKYHTLVNTLPKDRQLAWLTLSGAKLSVETKLQAAELELQKILLGWETKDLVELKAAIDKYKEQLKMMPETRKGFTRYLDGINDSLMVFEKRASGLKPGQKAWIEDPESLILKANKRFLELRLAEEKRLENEQNKNAEAARFAAHVKNEYVRLESEYKVTLLTTINTAYQQALNDELTDDGLKQYVKVTEAALREVKLGARNKFNYTINTPEELTALNSTIPAPNYTATLDNAIKFMYEKFQLYFQDRANAEKAKEYHNQKTQQLTGLVQDAATKQMSVNNLVSRGAEVEVQPTGGIPAIKRKMEIVIEDTPEFANRVVSAFLANWADCSKNVRVEKWSNLSVKQMAKALEDLPSGEMVEGLKYQETIK